MEHTIHPDHAHEHSATCGHVAVEHDGHVDYLHDGHLHSVHGDHIDEHVLTPNESGAACGTHACDAHATSHEHDPTCGHERVPHGDHTDYLVGSHLHHEHAGHCDDHGVVTRR